MKDFLHKTLIHPKHTHSSAGWVDEVVGKNGAEKKPCPPVASSFVICWCWQDYDIHTNGRYHLIVSYAVGFMGLTSIVLCKHLESHLKTVWLVR